MLKRLGFLAALFCAPLSAMAAVINIEYTGHINYSELASYSYGQQVSGNVQVDLSKSNGDELPEDYKALYTSWTNHDLVSGHFSDDIGFSGDRIELFNNSNEKYSGNYVDYLGTVDAMIEFLADGSWAYNTMQLNLGLAGLDWIKNDSLDIHNIFVNDASVFDGSFGVFLSGWGSYNSDGELQLGSTSAHFTFDSLKITSASVSEPSALLLLLMGLAGIGARRKFWGVC